ncbi:hypothetical protein PVK06_043607 [Gossypium arboreum]|uniref:Reverse transcriptase domain-containing protein n=1 Tax=Gossypium arboreum TaxID=29729 RepID=A0ABR0MQN9_GOSAR|nr:hypothetical protein PVK06_043607 [Gossypium arboreum]
MHVTGFYGHVNQNLRSNSWDRLRKVGDSVREDWVVGGDFNAILNDTKKEGGHRGVRMHMNDFKEVMDNLTLVDIKPYSGWEAKNIIGRVWNRDDTDYGNKIERVREDSGKTLKETRRRLDFLYAREESYWAQRFWSKWLKERDRNTRYFHAKATRRLKKNNIQRLKDIEGNWVLGYIKECVTRETNEWFNMDYTKNEIFHAIKQMDPNKGPGTGGLSGNFFKHHLEIVGNDTISFCLDVLNGNKNISSLNETMIILIPKIIDPCELTNFHPISLCGFVRKIISEVYANRLKAVLPSCISLNQSAFVPRRMIHDNILIVHELLYYLQSSKNGPNKGFVVKLDMSKAYFILEWGLRQGDPLSPYLFLFSMEAFSKMLIHAQENKVLRGIWASRKGPRINHLFFIDDVLLFVRNKTSDVESLVNMLNNFSNISSEEINFEKSMALFNLNTSRAQTSNFSEILGMTVVENINNYLSLPIPIGKKKISSFKEINNRLSCRINSWTKRLLSFGGKEVFVKPVLQSIPTYTL